MLSFTSDYVVFSAQRKQRFVFRCQDTSDPGHFGPKTFRHYQTGAEVSGQFSTSAEVSLAENIPPVSGAELSRPVKAYSISHLLLSLCVRLLYFVKSLVIFWMKVSRNIFAL